VRTEALQKRLEARGAADSDADAPGGGAADGGLLSPGRGGVGALAGRGLTAALGRGVGGRGLSPRREKVELFILDPLVVAGGTTAAGAARRDPNNPLLSVTDSVHDAQGESAGVGAAAGASAGTSSAGTSGGGTDGGGGGDGSAVVMTPLQPEFVTSSLDSDSDSSDSDTEERSVVVAGVSGNGNGNHAYARRVATDAGAPLRNGSKGSLSSSDGA
jgi:hypothetical protein